VTARLIPSACTLVLMCVYDSLASKAARLGTKNVRTLVNVAVDLFTSVRTFLRRLYPSLSRPRRLRKVA